MKGNNTYFDSFRQKDVEHFLASYKRTLKQCTSIHEKTTTQVAFGKLCEKFSLYTWAIKTYETLIEEASDQKSAYLSLAHLYGKLQLTYSQKKILSTIAERFPEEKESINLLQNLEKQFPHKTVTFYIPAYNVDQYIATAIEGVQQQSYNINEILVINDGSTDRSIEIASRYPVTIIHHKKNKGLAAARNTALLHAKGDFLATIDTDAIPDRFWLERLMLSFTSSQVVGAGGKLIEKNTVTAIDRWRQVRLKQDYGDAIREDDEAHLFGCNTVFKVDMLRKIEGYNEQFRTNYEDMDLSLRLKASGFITRYIPDAVCYHLRTDTLHSAVDTCYNWRRAYFEEKGAFTDITLLKNKSITDLNMNMGDVNELIENQQFDILYPNYLSTIRTVFKDLCDFYTLNPSEQNRNTFKAGYILLIYILKNTPYVSQQFLHYILEDIDDIASILETTSLSLTELKQQIFDVVEKEADAATILSLFNISSCYHSDYIAAVFSKMTILVNMQDVAFDMIEASARRIRYEEKHSPYTNGPRVMLVNPPWTVRNRSGVRAGSRWPFTSPKSDNNRVGYVPYPFFLGYLSSLLHTNGINTILVDAIAEKLTNQEFIERVAGFEPHIIVMEVATASYVVDNLWVLKIKERLPGVTIIWTGTHVSALQEKIIEENRLVNFVINGEYEKTTATLIDALIHHKDYTHLKGLIYRNDKGTLIHTGRTEAIENLDDLPWPERLRVPTYNYNDLFAGMEYPSVQVHASRGCPFGCIFCVWPQVLYGSRKYRTRDPKKVVDEIENLVNAYGYKSVYFDDDTFNIGKERILQLCEEMEKRNVQIAWGAMARADTTDYETLAAMKKAGLVGIKFGVESGSQKMIAAAEKGLDRAAVEHAVQWCKDLKIKTHLTFTFGLPGETEKSIQETIDFAKQLNPDTIQFSITTPFPGTKYYDLYKKEGNILTDEWEMFDGGQYTVIKSDMVSKKDLEEATRRAHAEFFKRDC